MARGANDGLSDAALGVTCLYAISDPVSGRCVRASAGHPPPIVADASGSVALSPLAPGPPLGLGGLPCENVELNLSGGSVVAFFTDGSWRTGVPTSTAESTALPKCSPGTDAHGRNCATGRCRPCRPTRPWWLTPAPSASANGRPGAARTGVHRRTRGQRAGHQQHPVRHRARPAEADQGPLPAVRGLRRRAHRTSPAARASGR
ncbi:SpoIIE family protein phosphatase [Streptomyces roseochromogenus]|uniref:SpoIIE family protein phosphatase n=1 Tax=Streptomyces roseochromogenus TaxID=285450 RepID=UPI003CC90D83